ncbi:hypothetical protein BDA96_09G082300 [Sorghum bicolor]|uniref:Uncharacterized protein n=1 Tax=Sorghum bicolor TaxID=4558 RepID=A0A921QBQ2_SORBI|nr:hypothetical protein BDA96_09G082300 [Sorghum bicolor]
MHFFRHRSFQVQQLMHTLTERYRFSQGIYYTI